MSITVDLAFYSIKLDLNKDFSDVSNLQILAVLFICVKSYFAQFQRCKLQIHVCFYSAQSLSSL